MGDYNPHAPYIVGQEMVPLQEQNINLTPNFRDVEYGVGFTVSDTDTTGDTRFTSFNDPNGTTIPAFGYVDMSLYTEQGFLRMQNNPIRILRIPLNNASVSGGAALVTSGSTYGERSITAEYLPSSLINGAAYAHLFFATGEHAQFLATKRILNISLSYRGFVVTTDSTGKPIQFVHPYPYLSPLTFVRANITPPFPYFNFVPPSIHSNTGSLSLATSPEFFQGTITFGSTSINQLQGPVQAEVQVLDMGDYAPQLVTTLGRWTGATLAGFDRIGGPGNRWVRIEFRPPNVSASTNSTIDYPYIEIYDIALDVTYCDETRVAIGTRSSPTLVGNRTPMSVQTVDLSSLSVTGSNSSLGPLPPGNYVLTVSRPSSGAQNVSLTLNAQSPTLNAVYQLNNLPSHPGYEIRYSYPPHTGRWHDNTSEGIVSVSESNVVPHLHIVKALDGQINFTSKEYSPAYGRQAYGPVYNNFVVAQGIDDSAIPSNTPVSFVRFYARRYGNTSVPLKVTCNTSTASLTAEELDLIEKISSEGWRQVTLELDSALTLGSSTFPQVVFSAPGETAANRWEVLGASSPVVSAFELDGNFAGGFPIPSGPATYGGSAQNMRWRYQFMPVVSGAIPDFTSDVSVFFSQLPPEVTGLSSSVQTQLLTGIGQDCLGDPCCVPSELYYLQLNWGNSLGGAGGIRDTFNRTEVGSWGSPDVGDDSYSAIGTPGSIDVDDGFGYIQSSATPAASYGVRIPYGASSNAEATFRVTNLSPTVTGSDTVTLTIGMAYDAAITDGYSVQLVMFANSEVDITILKNATPLGNTVTLPAWAPQSADSPLHAGYGSTVNVRIVQDNGWIKFKLWPPSSPEPLMWTIAAQDTGTIITNNNFTLSVAHSGVYGALFQFSDLELTPPQFWFGYYELQRQDELEDWKTIMKATNPATISYRDYEARVGITSNYRIRYANKYEFFGAWSPEVSGMIPEIGVIGGECLDGGNLLIFTTNERQDGSSNLAYSSVWLDAQVDENFTFPESDFVQLQAMYDQDFYTAFRPLERGGEQFTRTVLVQAAAISPETLADFSSLRDMAWDTVNYICVRDQDGNRWFATVTVPSGNVLRNRRLYLAPVNVIEVTETPTPVNPDPWENA